MSSRGRGKRRFGRWNRGVPIGNPVILGTKLKKAFRIHLVSILIPIFHSSLITLHSALLTITIVKMLQFLKMVPGSWFAVDG